MLVLTYGQNVERRNVEKTNRRKQLFSTIDMAFFFSIFCFVFHSVFIVNYLFFRKISFPPILSIRRYALPKCCPFEVFCFQPFGIRCFGIPRFVTFVLVVSAKTTKGLNDERQNVKCKKVERAKRRKKWNETILLVRNLGTNSKSLLKNDCFRRFVDSKLCLSTCCPMKFYYSTFYPSTFRLSTFHP